VKAVMLVMVLSGCTYSHYRDSGGIEAYGWSFGSNNALEGLQYSKSLQGTQFQIKGLEQNQTDAVKSLVEGAVKGAIAGVKP
jgi:hypothetical protein